MFVCEYCVRDYVVAIPLNTCPRSFGACEDCKKEAVCYDLPSRSFYHKESGMAMKIKEEKESFNPSRRENRPQCYGDSIHCPVLFTKAMYNCPYYEACEKLTRDRYYGLVRHSYDQFSP